VSAAVALVLLLAMVMAAGCTEQSDIITLSPVVPTETIAISDKDRAVQAVSDAEKKIQEVDTIIACFRGNASTRNDYQLSAIVTKREVAYSYLSTAGDEIRNGNYAKAQNKAKEALQKANESYNDALKMQGTTYSMSYPPCERSLPFDKIVCILLIFLVPVLLNVLLYSLIQSNPSAKEIPLGRFMGTTTVYVLFIAMSLLFTALVFGTKVANIGALRQLMYLARYHGYS